MPKPKPAPGPTPGPWVSERCVENVVRVMRGGWVVARVYDVPDRPDAETDANGALLAAAPALMAALEDILEAAEKFGRMSMASARAMTQARAALKSARPGRRGR